MLCEVLNCGYMDKNRLTDDFAPLRLRSPFGEMFGEPVAGPERAYHHPIPGQLIRRTRRGADAPAHGDSDERARQ